MNAGIVLYNMEEYEKAAEFFGEAIAKAIDDRSKEKAWWFKANAELVDGNYEMARYSFHMTFGFDGVYRREAFRQLRILDAYLGYIDFQDIEPEVIDP
jgi:tetratricopeptide (TPR) repeat protein